MADTHCAACERIEPWREPWPVCRSCSTPVCPDHMAPDSLQDHDERGLDCVCQPCQRLAEGLAAGLTLNTQWHLWHVAESILAPSNQNLLNGDLVACFRDVAQMAMAAKETAKELAPRPHGEPQP